MKFIIYLDRKKEYRWRLVARNGKKIADSGEGYKRKLSCQKMIVKFCDAVVAPVVDLTVKNGRK